MIIRVNDIGLEREVEDIKKIENVIHDTLDNEDIVEYYVEFTIKGNNLSWKDWMYYDEFKRLNPEIKV